MMGLNAIGLLLPRVQPNDDLAALLASEFARLGYSPFEQDVVVVAQKIVSKAEGRYVRLADVQPSPDAVELAERLGRHPAIVSLILSETRRVVRAVRQVIIVQDRRGLVMANAGIDQSNLDPQATGGEAVLLLPEDPDASAAALRGSLQERLGVSPGIVISDSFGRAWRNGTVGVAIGVSGLPALLDLRGQPDLFGRTLQATVSAFADQIASLGCLLMGEGAEGVPAVLIRGLSWTAPAGRGQDLIRPDAEDMFQ